jgi:drug/metabolite transporter (DMT)-like permease
MNSGYLYLAAGLASFSLLGIFAKVGDRKGCRAGSLYLIIFLSAAMLSAVAAYASEHDVLRIPSVVIGIAIPFGALGALAGVALQVGIRYGKLATSWLIINLSAAVPTLGSVLFYGERINARHVLALCLMVMSVILLAKDRQQDQRNAARATAADRENVCG